MIAALAMTARAGGRANLVVDGNPYDPQGDVRGSDEEALTLARRLNINVFRSPTPMHLKAAIVSTGCYLSDRNWSRTAVVLFDRDPVDYAAVSDAAKGSPRSVSHGSDGGLALVKEQALALEAQLLAQGVRLSIESESFSAGNPVYQQLYAHAAGARLIIAATEYRQKASERAAVARLVARGASVRTSGANEKIALAGDGVYVGSANATSGVENQVEWGLVTHDIAIVTLVRNRFEAEWSEGAPVR